MRRSGLACDRCIPYMSASSEPPTVLAQCLQGPVPFTRMCPSLACDCHRTKPAVPGFPTETHSNTALSDAGGLQGRASEEILPLRPRSAAVDFRPARFRRLEVFCQAEKALKCKYILDHQNESCQMVNRWGILAAPSSFCHSGGAQMESCEIRLGC